MHWRTGLVAPAVRGKPLDAALGLPRAIIYEKRWVQWLVLLFGLGAFGFGLWATIVALRGHPYESKYGALIYVCLPVGPLIGLEAARSIRRWPCIVIAENGFDDRTSEHPAGPIAWYEVAGISTERALHVGAGCSAALPNLVIRLNPGPREPLSPLGPIPKQIREVRLQLPLDQHRRAAQMLAAALAEWRDREALYAGFED
jgi:hypothetical protein